jgi:hypothetical protein
VKLPAVLSPMWTTIVLLLFACRDRAYDATRSTGTTTLTAASRVDEGAAIQVLVAARCTRELRCGNVGPSKYFTTFDACGLEVAKYMRHELEAEPCPSGIERSALDTCVEKLRADACPDAGPPQISVMRRRPVPRSIEALGRLATCPTRELCL